MRKIILGCTILLATVLVASPVVAAPAADSLDDAQLQRVGQSCRQTQVQLRSMQKRDTVLRINRGRLYDMTLRQTGAFAARLDVNKIDSPDIKQADSAIRAQLQHFKENYDHYADNLSLAITIDCAQKPREFYALLGQAAQTRQEVSKDIAEIKQSLGRYVGALQNLNEAMFPLAEGQP